MTMENVLIKISDKIWDTGDSGGERTNWNRVRAIVQECDRWRDLVNPLQQCFSTAGPQPGTWPWHQLYQARRSLRKLQYATRFH